MNCGSEALLPFIIGPSLGLICMRDGRLWWIWRVAVNDGDFIAAEQADLLTMDNDAAALI